MSHNVSVSESKSINLPELTSVRAFAALIVVIYHMYGSHSPNSELLKSLVSKGYLGVDFFFILSGFILTHVYISRWRSGRFKYGQFLWSRFSRVYPVHLVMLVVSVAGYLAAEKIGFENLGGMRWNHLPWHALLLHSWGFTDGYAWNSPSWSVSAEAFAYLIFPLFLFVLPINRVKSTVLLATSWMIAAWLIMQACGLNLTELTYNFGIIRILFEFTLGVSMYILYERADIRPKIAAMLATVMFLSFLFVVVVRGPDLISLFLFALIILFLGIRARCTQPSLLRSRPLIYLGTISYSTYMVHIFVLLMMKPILVRIFPETQWGGLIGVTATLLVIYVGSILLYHLIENPSRKFLISLARKHETKVIGK